MRACLIQKIPAGEERWPRIWDLAVALRETPTSRWNSCICSLWYFYLVFSCLMATCCPLILLQVNEKDLVETIRLLSSRMDIRHTIPPEHSCISHNHPFFWLSEDMRNGGKCQKCFTRVRMPIITPCAHLVCTCCLADMRYSGNTNQLPLSWLLKVLYHLLNYLNQSIFWLASYWWC